MSFVEQNNGEIHLDLLGTEDQPVAHITEEDSFFSILSSEQTFFSVEQEDSIKKTVASQTGSTVDTRSRLIVKLTCKQALMLL